MLLLSRTVALGGRLQIHSLRKASVGMTGVSSAITSRCAASHTRADERFWIPFKTYAEDGGARPNSGGTPFRQPCPAYPSTIGRKAPQERFSEESFRTCTSSGNAFLYSFTVSFLPTRQQNSQHTASLDVLAEPNYYNKCRRTSSTRVFASHETDDWKQLANVSHRAALADSASSLYTTSFPIHSMARSV